MIEKLLGGARVRGLNAAENLRIILAEFCLFLRGQGYALRTLTEYAGVVASFCRWMAARSVEVPSLSETAVEGFLRKRRLRRGRAGLRLESIRRRRWILRQLLVFLRQKGRIRSKARPQGSAAERLIGRYDCYLAQVAGLTDTTRRTLLCYARQFLRWRFGSRPVELRRLQPSDIHRFVQHRAAHLSPGGVRGLAAALRSFLRFLHFTGRVDQRLVQAVVCPAPAPRNPLPETLSPTQSRSFLRGFDRTQPIGQRDFAMALCLCRLGLRAGEVASLRLEDLDWHGHILRLQHTKSRRGRMLPLPAEVAKALRSYLRTGRPQTQSRILFVRHRVPSRGKQGVHLVLSAMRRAFGRRGLEGKGVHIFRHTFATRLHRRGVDLKRIADLLGHQSLDTTARYARVNFQELRQAALPWPERWR